MTVKPLIILLVALAMEAAAQRSRVTQADMDRALEDYVTHDVPDFENPTKVSIGVYINSIVLNYETGIMKMNMYLRQAWRDERFVAMFDGKDDDVKHATLDDKSIAKVWRPDLFVRNADATERINALTTEHLFRVNRTGHVWYVVRLINSIYCKSILSGRREVTCSIMFESFSYTMDYMYLGWLPSAADVDKGVALRLHNLHNVTLHDCSQNYTAGAFPCLQINFQMKRRALEATFETGIYLISSFLVIISWFGFWIPPSEKRVFLGLGVSLILAVLYMAVAEWRDYSFADRTVVAQIWMTFCLALVLAMVLEFGTVYVLLGTVRARMRGLCGGSSEQDDLQPKRSRCADIVDTVFGLVIFPLVFIVTLIIFYSSVNVFN